MEESHLGHGAAQRPRLIGVALVEEASQGRAARSGVGVRWPAEELLGLLHSEAEARFEIGRDGQIEVLSVVQLPADDPIALVVVVEAQGWEYDVGRIGDVATTGLDEATTLRLFAPGLADKTKANA